MASFADKENASANEGNLLQCLVFSPPAKHVEVKKSHKNGAAAASAVMPSLLTARFQQAMHIEFGNSPVPVNATREVRFKLINPSESKAVTVSVDKVPSDKGFSITLGEEGASTVEIPGGGVTVGTVHWTPTTDMTVREVATLKLMDKSPLQVILRGIAGKGQATSAPAEKVDYATKRKALAAIANNVNLNPTASHKAASSASSSSSSNTDSTTQLRRQAQGKPVAEKVSIKRMYDDKWAEKQIESFTEWMNFSIAQTDSSKSEGGEEKSGDGTAASGLRLLMQRRKEAQIRQRAMLIFHSTEVAVPLFALGEEICENRLMVREDRDVHADLGLQETLLGLLFSYELPWLRLGLEVVFGQIISFRSGGSGGAGTDVPCTVGSAKWKKVLKAFIFEHLFADADIQAKFPKEKLLYKANQLQLKELLRAHLVKKFLALVLVIDNAREQQLLSHPMIFTRGSTVKASKDVLLSFCCDFLRGEGDFIRHLSLLGYNVSFTQTYTDEFDYAVTNLAVDLRDGVRLTRLVEVLMKTSDLSTQLRVPAGSYLQKVHNVKLAMSRIYDKSEPMPDPKQIVEGHRDTTLMLLWKLMYGFELKMLIDPARVRKEATAIRRNQRWRRSVYGRAEAEQLAVAVPVYTENGGISFPYSAAGDDENVAEESNDNELAAALLVWCSAVAGQYGVSVYNLTSCLADGRALCMLVHYYHPSILPTKAIKKTTQNLVADFAASNTALDIYTESCAEIPKVDAQKAVNNERKNFATLKRACSDIGGVPTMLPSYDSGNQPEAKTMTVFLGYLFARLIESSEQVRAAIRIQRTYRGCAEALRRSFVPKALKMKAVPTKKVAPVRQPETLGVTDVCVTVVMSTHHAANVIKRLIMTFCQRRAYLRFLDQRAYNQQQAELFEMLQRKAAETEAILIAEAAEREACMIAEAAENEARLLAEEAQLILQKEEERIRRIEEAEAERTRLMEMHEETALLAIEEANAARAEAESAEQQRQIALEEAEIAKAEAEAAEALLQEAQEQAENAREEAEAEAEAREALERQLGLYEEAKCVAEEQARMLDEYRLELEKRVSEGSMTAADLRMQLETAQSAKISAEAEAHANYEARLQALANLAEEREAAAKVIELAREAEAARLAQEKLEAVIKAEKESREAAEEEAKMKAEYSYALELRIKELEEARSVELAAAVEAERVRVETETRLAMELAQRVEEARLAAEELAQRKVEEEAQIAAAAVQAEREARIAAEAQTMAEAAARMAAEAQLRAIEESRLAAELEAKRIVEEEQLLMMIYTDASTRIQSAWRSYSASSNLRLIKKAALRVQALWRGRAIRSYILQLNVCASIIQAVWRQCHMRRLWNKYNAAATKVQSKWRSTSQHAKFVTVKKSVTTLTRWWKKESARLSMQKSMRDALRTALSTASAEAAKERILSLQNSSANSIAKWFRARLLYVRACRLCGGFRRLQAFYRALCIRRKSTAAVKALRVRIIDAEKRAIADPNLCLGKQTKTSLEVLQSGKMISHLLKACQTLELSTQVSVKCCQAFTEAQASSVLFGLIRSCNRSTPHQEVLRHALVVLLNVARHTQLAAFVAQSSDSTDVLVDLMQMFRDKQPIFSLSCELLGRLAAASEVTKNICNSADYKKRLDGILHIIERKHRLDQRVRNIGANKAAEFVGSPKGRGKYLAEMDPIHGVQHLFFVLESKVN